MKQTKFDAMPVTKAADTLFPTQTQRRCDKCGVSATFTAPSKAVKDGTA